MWIKEEGFILLIWILKTILHTTPIFDFIEVNLTSAYNNTAASTTTTTTTITAATMSYL
jgi:hypothetical protein